MSHEQDSWGRSECERAEEKHIACFDREVDAPEPEPKRCICAAHNYDECICGAWDDLDPHKLKAELAEAKSHLSDMSKAVADMERKLHHECQAHELTKKRVVELEAENNRDRRSMRNCGNCALIKDKDRPCEPEIGWFCDGWNGQP